MFLGIMRRCIWLREMLEKGVLWEGVLRLEKGWPRVGLGVVHMQKLETWNRVCC